MPRDPVMMEKVTSAHRHLGADGNLRALPAWHDLTLEDRREAFDATVVQRRLESALDAQGLSSTGYAVLANIARLGPVE